MTPTMSTVCNGNIGTMTGPMADAETTDGSLKPPGILGSAKLSETLRIGVRGGEVDVDGALVIFQGAVVANLESGAEYVLNNASNPPPATSLLWI